MIERSRFRPLQGLPIINLVGKIVGTNAALSFRPLQGLPIINPYLQKPDKHYLK